MIHSPLAVRPLTPSRILSMAEPRARAFLSLQQELIREGVASDAGDASARERLKRWMMIARVYVADIELLTIASSAGDEAARQRLWAIRADLVRQWLASAQSKAGRPGRKMMT